MLLTDPTLRSEGTLSDLGDTRSFTLTPNAKAFRLLIDGLYSDKIKAPMRELASNAFDAHLEAGCPDRPFEVQLPTLLDPTFGVRDYGSGMDHDTVMNLYTTMFASSKDTNNAQVGGFGIGSKSPFAYADTFSVTCFDGTEARDYFAHLASTGVPVLTHLETRPCSEERGVRVSFPVRTSDLNAFQWKWDYLRSGFPVQPIVNLTLAPLPVAPHSGTGWSMTPKLPSTYHPGSLGVRQGCVIYPANWISHPQGNWLFEVPIGSFAVTATREALDETPEATALLSDLLARAVSELTSRLVLDIHSAPNLVEAAEKFAALTDPAKILVPIPLCFDNKGNHKTAIGWRQAQDLKVLVSRHDEKIPRRASRLAAWRRVNKSALELNDPRQLRSLIRALGLRSDQIVSVASLPDVPVKSRAAQSVSEVRGIENRRGQLMMADEFPADWIIWDGCLSITTARLAAAPVQVFRVQPYAEKRAVKLGGRFVSTESLFAPHRAAADEWARRRSEDIDVNHLAPEVRRLILGRDPVAYDEPYAAIGSAPSDHPNPTDRYPLLRRCTDVDPAHQLAYVTWCDQLAADAATLPDSSTLQENEDPQ